MSAPRMSEPRVVSTGRDQVGESPAWDPATQALYWVDIEGRQVHRLDRASAQQQTWNLPERVGCIALTAAHCDGLITPNGLAFSPDDSILYFSDSHPSVQKVWAFDFDLAQGRLGAGREFLDMTQMPGRPDGAAVDVDVEGCHWICGNDAGLVHRFSPAGALLSSHPVPVAKPSMCAFGGPQLDTLLVTSICPAGVAGGLCGAVFAFDAGVRGRAEPRFSRFPSVGA